MQLPLMLFLACTMSVALCRRMPVQPPCVTVKTAFTIHDTTYLKTNLGKWYQMTDHREHEGRMLMFHGPLGEDYDAMAFIPSKRQFVTFKNDTLDVLGIGDKLQSVSDPDLERFSHAAHTDAATVFDSELFLFQGKTYQAMSVFGRQKPVKGYMRDLRLPNDVDAAWYDRDENAAVVLKGDSIWLGVREGRNEIRFYGPLPFSRMYVFQSLKLCPTAQK